MSHELDAEAKLVLASVELEKAKKRISELEIEVLKNKRLRIDIGNDLVPVGHLGHGGYGEVFLCE